MISGDPIRAAGGSSYNIARNNTFTTGKSYQKKTVGSGHYGVFTYWVFGRAKKCGKGNKFYGKKTYLSYYKESIPGAASGSDVSHFSCKSVTRAGS